MTNTDRAYATVQWMPEDIQQLQPDWTLEQCEEWLQSNETHLSDRLIELGWDVIGDLI